MFLRQFGNIGKAVLTNALGLQKNYTEIEEKEITVVDQERTGCANCKWHFLKEMSISDDNLKNRCGHACENCSHKIMKTEKVHKKIYHNERNRYGYLPRLKTNAIKLFIAYHMYGPDTNGFIKNLSIKELAKLLDCDIKTIKNNNEILKNYGYIYYSSASLDQLTVFLPAYNTYYLPANKGGRGFLAVSDTVFKEILNMKSLNEIRIALRQLMDFDILTNKGITAEYKPVSEIRKILPDYCKPNIVKRAVQTISLFITEITERSIKFTIKPKYNAKMDKVERQNQYLSMLDAFVQELNQEISYKNTSTVSINELKYKDFFRDSEEVHPVFYLSEVEKEDLAALSIQYSFSIVIKAFSKVYTSYYLIDKRPLNLGGLVHSFILSDFEMSA